jgi:membrane-bound ClpP family serine protease
MDYHLLILHDARSLTRADANRIYRSVSSGNPQSPILLILNSQGGDITAGYFIAKLCREYTKALFEAVVPRQAKSAATLICCGADRIHMGSLSELGPIDPQFGAVPALALKHSIEHLAQLASQYPGASRMFSDYLAQSLRVEALGYYERVAESASHYALRLLNARKETGRTAEENAEAAQRLVYAYKDHGFAIDSGEAADIFGAKVVVSNSAQYSGGNELYTELDFIDYVLRKRFNRDMSFVGDPGSGCMVLELPST